jgi:hypothetical protein
MLFLALAVPATYLYARPSLEEIAKFRWLDDINVMISKSVAYAKPKAEVSPVDPIAAANVDEDLDYRIAQRTKSTEGWRSFLTAHPGGSHAQFARAELDKLVLPVTPPAPAAEQAPDRGPPETKIPSEVVSPPPPSAGTEAAPAASQAQDRAPPDTKAPSDVVSPPPPFAGPEAATLASDEICRGDADRLDQLSNSLTSDGVIRFLIELRCEKLRPQLIRLAERLEAPAPKPDVADTPHVLSASISPEPDVSTINPPLPPKRAAEPPNKSRPSIVPPRRPSSASTAPSLPPILLALFGEHPKSSARFHRTRAGGRFGPNGGAVGNGGH